MTPDDESRWTRPTQLCPHPNRWHSVDVEATEVEVSEFVAAAVRAHQPDVVFETGTYTGQTTKMIASVLDECGGRLVTFEMLKRNVSGAQHTMMHRDFVKFVHADTMSVDFGWYLHDGENVDFAWLDSGMYDHKTKQLIRIAELTKLRPYLSRRAIVMMHDTAPHHPLRAALRAIDWMTWVHLPTPRGVSIGQMND